MFFLLLKGLCIMLHDSLLHGDERVFYDVSRVAMNNYTIHFYSLYYHLESNAFRVLFRILMYNWDWQINSLVFFLYPSHSLYPNLYFIFLLPSLPSLFPFSVSKCTCLMLFYTLLHTDESGAYVSIFHVHQGQVSNGQGENSEFITTYMLLSSNITNFSQTSFSQLCHV